MLSGSSCGLSFISTDSSFFSYLFTSLSLICGINSVNMNWSTLVQSYAKCLPLDCTSIGLILLSSLSKGLSHFCQSTNTATYLITVGFPSLSNAHQSGKSRPFLFDSIIFPRAVTEVAISTVM